DAGGAPGVHEVVHDQHLAAALGNLQHRLADLLEYLDHALVLVIVALHGHGLHGADVELTRNNGGRYETATGDRHNGVVSAIAGEAPGQGAAVAVELVPGDGERLLVGIGQTGISKAEWSL